MKMSQNNSKFNGREGKCSNISLENPQTSKLSLSLSSLSEKQENIDVIPRVILGEKTSNLFLQIIEQNVERDNKKNE